MYQQVVTPVAPLSQQVMAVSSFTRIHELKQKKLVTHMVLYANESLYSSHRLVISVAFVTVLLKIQLTTWITLMGKNVRGASLLTMFLTCQTRFIQKPLFDGIFSQFAVCTEVGGFVFVSYRSKGVGNVYAGGEIIT